MSGFGGNWARLLNGAIEAARATLRDLEAAEVPAPLARIAASHGGRLPPPLAARLLAELDSNEWLREKVAEDFAPDESDPSWLFLGRPDQWWLRLSELAADWEQGEHERKLEALRSELTAMEGRRALAGKRAKEYKRAAAAARARAKELEASAHSDVAARYALELSELDSLRRELEVSRQRIEEMQMEHHDLQAAFDALRERYARARRSRPSEESGGGSSGFVPTDPVKLARMLDLQSAAFGRDMASPVPAAEPVPVHLSLAPGVRPDSSDAIRWLLDLDTPVLLVVDGYNAQFHIDRSDFTSGGARRRLIDVLHRLLNGAALSHRIVVVYDSTLPGSREPSTSVGGVEVRFAPDDRIADEEIVEMVVGHSPIVVISSDREVREGAESNGAVVLWSEALADWVGRS